MTKLAPALDAALTYAAHGLKSFPIKPRSKAPATEHGFKDATLDGGILHRRFAAAGVDANVGIATGGGLIVVDLDGPEAEEWWAAHHGGHPTQPTWTWIATTGREDGGRHLYFKVDRPVSTRPQKGGIGPHVDVKGEGGYVVAPPSVHPDGPTYIWEQGGPDTKLAILPAPAWLLAQLDEPRPREYTNDRLSDRGPIAEGGRDNALAASAGAMRRRGMSAGQIEAALLVENRERCNPPLPDADVRRIARSVGRYAPDPVAVADDRLEAAVQAKGQVASSPPRQLRNATQAVPAADVGDGSLIGVSASDIEARSVRWLWKGRLPLGMLVILDGDPGLGKSTIVADWIARVTTGTPWPTGEPCERGGAIYVGAEDPPAEVVVPRLRAAGADLSRVRIVTTVPVKGGERLPTLPADLALFEHAIRETGARLLVFDPIISYVAAELSSYSDKDVRQALTPLADMLAGTNCTGLMLRHLRKDDKAAAAMYRGGGSIAFVAVARAGFAVAKIKGADGATALMPTKANLAPKSKAMRYSLEQAELAGGIETSRVAWGEETDDDPDESMTAFGTGEGKPREKAELFIQEFLGKGPRPSGDLDAAARKAGISRRTMFRARDELEVKALRVGADAWWVALPEHEELLRHITDVRQPRVPNAVPAANSGFSPASTVPNALSSKIGTLYSEGTLEVALYPPKEAKSATVPLGNIRAHAREDEGATSDGDHRPEDALAPASNADVASSPCPHDAGVVMKRGRRFCAACAAALDAVAPAA